ncbi:glycosyltransferase [bacterium]|nr:glycosyltransferase [bacterium]
MEVPHACRPDPDEVVPGFVRRLLLIGDIPQKFNRRFSRGIEEIWGADGVSLPVGRFNPNHFDCILINHRYNSSAELSVAISALMPYLSIHGCIKVLEDGLQKNICSIDKIGGFWGELGLLCYKMLPEENRPSQSVKAVIAVRKTYSPFAHARKMADNDQYNVSIDILNWIPQTLKEDKEVLAQVASEKQRYYLDWQKSLPPDVPRHKFFFPSSREFAQVTCLRPHQGSAYRTLADFYRHMGEDDMAVRVLRSIRHIAVEDEVRSHSPSVVKRKPNGRCSEKSPQWSGLQRPPRLLIITHDHSDYCMDTLFDGLCRVLGVQNVTEYPWKPVLHGKNSAAAHNYPCAFNYPGEPESVDQIVQELADHRFDVIIYADVVQMAYPREIRRIMDAGRNLPMVLYDTWDNCYTPMDRVLKYIGRETVDLYLKREMLSSIDYGPRAFPLPFGYPGERIANRIVKTRALDVFWAGKREWGLRPLYLERVEKLLGRTFTETFSQSEYTELLQESLIGLSFSGTGFDTVRYWEIPAHGGMLLTERPPIEIPHNFTDGQTAVFFEDLPELEEKLVHYIAHPQEAIKIAAAGHRHFLKFHTTTARARQLLGYLEKFFTWY